jgi:hypothetical protein
LTFGLSTFFFTVGVFYFDVLSVKHHYPMCGRQPYSRSYRM